MVEYDPGRVAHASSNGLHNPVSALAVASMLRSGRGMGLGMHMAMGGHGFHYGMGPQGPSPSHSTDPLGMGR